MALIQRNYNHTADIDTLNTNPIANRTYGRIVVLLDGTPAAERAIAAAIGHADPLTTKITLICTGFSGAQGYLDAKVKSLRQQRLQAHGYIVSNSVEELPAWIVKSAKPDLIVMTQKPQGWLGRILNNNLSAVLESRTRADVIAIDI